MYLWNFNLLQLRTRGPTPYHRKQSTGGVRRKHRRSEEEAQETLIANLTKELDSYRKKDVAITVEPGVYSISLNGASRPRDGNSDNRKNSEETIEIDVSSLGRVLTTGVAGLLKDDQFTEFCNKKAF